MRPLTQAEWEERYGEAGQVEGMEAPAAAPGPQVDGARELRLMVAAFALVGLVVIVGLAKPDLLGHKPRPGDIMLTLTSPTEGQVVDSSLPFLVTATADPAAQSGDVFAVTFALVEPGDITPATMTGSGNCSGSELSFGMDFFATPQWAGKQVEVSAVIKRDGVVVDSSGTVTIRLSGGTFIQIGSSDADATLWNDASKHRFSKYGDAHGGYHDVTTGTKGAGPAVPFQFQAPVVAGGYTAVLKANGHTWATVTGLTGSDEIQSGSFAALPQSSGSDDWESWLAAGAVTLTAELRRASDGSVVAEDEGGYTCFVPQVVVSTPGAGATVPDVFAATVRFDEWHYATGGMEALLVQSGLEYMVSPSGLIVHAAETLVDLTIDLIQAWLSAFPSGNYADIDPGAFTLRLRPESPLVDNDVALTHVQQYVIRIDSPDDGAYLGSGTAMRDVFWTWVQGWGKTTRVLVLTPNGWVVSGQVGHPESRERSWGISVEVPAGSTAIRVEWGEQSGEDFIVSASDEVNIVVDDDGEGGGDGEDGGGGGGEYTEPTLLIDLPAEGATVCAEFTAKLLYGGYTGGTGQLVVRLVGETSAAMLLEATKAIMAGGGSYVLPLTLPEGLAEGEYLLVARLTGVEHPEESDTDSHTLIYSAEGGGTGEAPVVEILEPVAGASVSGAVTVRVQATDDAGIYKLRLYVDGQWQGTVESPANGAVTEFTWDSKRWVNGSHTLRAVAQDVDLLSGEDSVVVNLVNARADRELVRFHVVCGVDAEGIPLAASPTFTDHPYTLSIEDLILPEPPEDPGLRYILQVGYNKPGTSRSWADYRPKQMEKSHGLTSATGRQISWAILATPQQTLASWEVATADMIRLAQGGGNLIYALCTGPHGVQAINTVSGVQEQFADLSGLPAAPVDMVYYGGKVAVAYADRLLLLDPDSGDLHIELGMPWPDEVTAISRIAVAGSSLAIAATLEAGGSRIYRYDGESLQRIADHAYEITALQALSGGLYGGNANGDVLQIGTSVAVAYATGQASVRSLGINGSTLFAGTGDEGNVYRRLVGWGSCGDMGFTQVRALAAYSGWLYAGGSGTGGQYLWYEREAASWVQALELAGATAVNDLLVTGSGGAEQLWAATTGDGTESALWRVEIADDAGQAVCGPEWIAAPRYGFKVLG